MTEKPKLSQAMVEAFNVWLDELKLEDEVRVLVAQTIMTGDYSNNGRPKYLQLAFEAFRTTHRYGAGLTTRQDVGFITDAPTDADTPVHAAFMITTLENARFTSAPMSAREQEPYRSVASLNDLIQKLIVDLTSDQQTKALAVAVYFTAAVRWCVTEGYQMIDGQKDVSKKAPSLRVWFYNAQKTHSIINLDYTPVFVEELDFTTVSSLRNSKS